MSTDSTIGKGWVRDENGAWRRETKPHMGRRLPGYDYCLPGCYVVTIVLADRRSQALGELLIKVSSVGAFGAGETERWVSVEEARGLGLAPDAVVAKVSFSPLGRAIFAHFRRMGQFTRGLRPVYCAVMPDHLHLLVEVVARLERPLGNAIGGFKTGCEKIFSSMGGQGRLFAPGFVDQIMLRAGQLANEFDYLTDNPRRLAVKRLFPELFKVRRRLKVAFRLVPKGLKNDDWSTSAAPAVLSAPAAPAVGCFAAIGNSFLLGRPDLRQVQCSRRFFAYSRDAKGRLLKEAPPALRTPEFDEKLAAALSAARAGSVIVSPCISQGEREIARRVFAAGGRLITLQNVGFSPVYKPGGRLFESCAAGNLLMLAPAAWPYQPAEKPMTRLDAQILNRIAQLIAGEGAVEIDYKGVTMADIDSAVAETVAEDFTRREKSS